MADYYKILGVSRDADVAAIKKAFRKLAMEYHPDRNPNNAQAEAKFKEVNEAYAVLSDPEKRRQYDTFGAQAFHQQFSRDDIFRGTDFSSVFEEMGFGGDLGSILGSIFGGSRPRGGKRGGGAKGARSGGAGGFGPEEMFSGFAGGPFGAGQAQRGRDVETSLEIDFLDAYHGAEKALTLTLPGAGRKDITVKIPRGVSDGTKLRMAGQGMGAPGAQAGDLYVELHPRKHERFVREGADISLPIVVRFSQACLGGSADVETPEGPRKIKIPPHVAAGTRIRLRGLGFPKTIGGSERGDLFAVVQIEVPRGLSERQRGLVEDLAANGL